MSYDWTVLWLILTDYDGFFGGSVRFLVNYLIMQPVAVAVMPNYVKFSN